jgi:hypothetical protein
MSGWSKMLVAGEGGMEELNQKGMSFLLNFLIGETRVQSREQTGHS